MCEPARHWPAGRFAVAGPLYPAELSWPANVERIEHVGPDRHGWFYSRQRFTLNVTRADMVRMGYSPSVRLFEAAACGTPIISDWWPGLDTIFVPGRAYPGRASRAATCSLISAIFPTSERRQLAIRAREHVLAHHTAAHRAIALEGYVEELLAAPRTAPRSPWPASGLSARDEARDLRPGGQLLLGKRSRRPVARADPGFAERGHRTVFFERDVPYYAQNRDLTSLEGGRLVLYGDWDEVLPEARRELADADAGMVTSYCPDALAATDLVLDAPGLHVFYDLDTPVTLAQLAAGKQVDYIGPDGLAPFDLVLSYTGGAALTALRQNGSARSGSRRCTAASIPTATGRLLRPSDAAPHCPISAPMPPTARTP